MTQNLIVNKIYRRVVVVLGAVLGCLMVPSLLIAQTQSLSQAISVDGVGWEGEGADLALTNLNHNPRPELILMAYDPNTHPKGSRNSFRYRIGWDVDTKGHAARWGNTVQVPGVSQHGQGAGMAVANFDDNPRPDLLLMTYDGKDFRYKIGFNLNDQGIATSWNPSQHTVHGFATSIKVPGIEACARGAAVAVGNINSNPRPEIVVLAQDNCTSFTLKEKGSEFGRDARRRNFRYRIGWDVDMNGRTKNWSTHWRKIASLSDWGRERKSERVEGVGIILQDFNGNARPDLLIVAHTHNELRYRLARDLDPLGVPIDWTSLTTLPSPVHRSPRGVISQGTSGVGVGLINVDTNPRQDLVMMVYDDQPKNNTFVYQIGWNWDPTPPHITMEHWPIHPDFGEDITFTVTIDDPSGIKQARFLLKKWSEDRRGPDTMLISKPLAVPCAQSPCVFEEHVTLTPQHLPVAYAVEVQDALGQSKQLGWREFSVGPPGHNPLIPIWRHGHSKEKIDVVFVPDGPSYTRTGWRWENKFFQDIQAVFAEGFLKDELLTTHIEKFNFYYMYYPGQANPTQRVTVFNAEIELCSAKISTDTRAAGYTKIVDTFGVLHTDDFRDCNPGTKGFTVYTERHIGPKFLHEMGHALFGLSDEYTSTPTIYFEQQPWSNAYCSRKACQDDATHMGWSGSDCRASDLYSEGRISAGDFFEVIPKHACHDVLDSNNKVYISDPSNDVMSKWRKALNDFRATDPNANRKGLPPGHNFGRGGRRQVIFVLDHGKPLEEIRGYR